MERDKLNEWWHNLSPEVKIELARKHRHRKIVEALIEKYKTKPNEQEGSTGANEDCKEQKGNERPERTLGSPGEANQADG